MEVALVMASIWDILGGYGTCRQVAASCKGGCKQLAQELQCTVLHLIWLIVSARFDFFCPATCRVLHNEGAS